MLVCWSIGLFVCGLNNKPTTGKPGRPHGGKETGLFVCCLNNKPQGDQQDQRWSCWFSCDWLVYFLTPHKETSLSPFVWSCWTHCCLPVVGSLFKPHTKRPISLPLCGLAGLPVVGLLSKPHTKRPADQLTRIWSLCVRLK